MRHAPDQGSFYQKVPSKFGYYDPAESDYQRPTIVLTAEQLLYRTSRPRAIYITRTSVLVHFTKSDYGMFRRIQKITLVFVSGEILILFENQIQARQRPLTVLRSTAAASFLVARFFIEYTKYKKSGEKIFKIRKT